MKLDENRQYTLKKIAEMTDRGITTIRRVAREVCPKPQPEKNGISYMYDYHELLTILENVKDKPKHPEVIGESENGVLLSNKGYQILVDKEDVKKITKLRWHITSKTKEKVYFAHDIRKNKKLISIPIHRFILGVMDTKLSVDHINGDTLDNRKRNLRLCTTSENMCNRGKTALNTSGYKGVSWIKRFGKWRAKISKNGRYIHLGYFDNKIDAYKAYSKAAKVYHGRFACVR